MTKVKLIRDRLIKKKEDLLASPEGQAAVSYWYTGELILIQHPQHMEFLSAVNDLADADSPYAVKQILEEYRLALDIPFPIKRSMLARLIGVQSTLTLPELEEIKKIAKEIKSSLNQNQTTHTLMDKLKHVIHNINATESGVEAITLWKQGQKEAIDNPRYLSLLGAIEKICRAETTHDLRYLFDHWAEALGVREFKFKQKGTDLNFIQGPKISDSELVEAQSYLQKMLDDFAPQFSA